MKSLFLDDVFIGIEFVKKFRQKSLQRLMESCTINQEEKSKCNDKYL